ncbi:immunity 22 family protein [sulfur-oxidizing endosymbiont of Gigantopelta aegis]|uniref:immunity 22 family protein n=1 Tax=sulfur-oxidizing endosymbiont of Gigantopelta aegis TaxID=2794934 RepID=UPI0018DD2C44|nr:immunity 22 family protein [sulfur-oxidizing endosymbiont of Gigantopelta aegis]
MQKKKVNVEKNFLFSKKNKVSVWASTHPYADIPDAYFEEKFSKKNTRASNAWSNNFKIQYFYPTNMETNGAHEGTINIKQAVGECSFSSSFIEVLMSKAKKKKLKEITWIILLFEYEYSAKISGIESDEYVTLVGAFDYDDDAERLYPIDDQDDTDDTDDTDSE